MGTGRGAGDRRITLPFAGRSTARVYRRVEGHASAGYDHRGAAGVRAVALVGTVAPQPDCPTPEGGATVPSRGRGYERALPHGCQARRLTSARIPSSLPERVGSKTTP